MNKIVERLLQEKNEVHFVHGNETLCGIGEHEIEARERDSGDLFFSDTYLSEPTGKSLGYGKTKCSDCMKVWQSERYRGD